MWPMTMIGPKTKAAAYVAEWSKRNPRTPEQNKRYKETAMAKRLAEEAENPELRLAREAKMLAYGRARRATQLAADRKKVFYEKLKNDPERWASVQARERGYCQRRRLELLAALGGVCAVCGEGDARVLEVDHVNGDGAEHRAQHVWSQSYYKEILAQANSGAYRLLCSCCHFIKKHEAGETVRGARIRRNEDVTGVAKPRSSKPLTRAYAARRHTDPKVAEADRAYARDYYARKRRELVEYMGSKCVTCGFSDYRALTIDHVHGGGNERRRRKSGEWKIAAMKGARDLVDQGILQLLCGSCNVRKRAVNNETSLGKPRPKKNEGVASNTWVVNRRKRKEAAARAALAATTDPSSEPPSHPQGSRRAQQVHPEPDQPA